MARGGPLPGNIAGGLREGPALDGAILGYRRLAAPDLLAVTGLVRTVLAFRTESVPGTAPGDACINLAAHRIGASLHCHGAVLSRDPPIPAIQTLARRPAARQHARPTPRTWIGPHGGCMQSSRPFWPADRARALRARPRPLQPRSARRMPESRPADGPRPPGRLGTAG